VKGTVLVAVVLFAIVAAVAMREKNCHFNTHLIGRIYCSDDG
jgi:hypothetical protein